MTTINYIDRSPIATKSKDYAHLREEALKVLRAYSQETWTDHNAHDPGITLLEALCYAITDVGNRLDFPIADILMSQEGLSAERIAENFPDIERILPNAALSLLDNRRLLADVSFGIRKLRIVPALSPELPVYLTPAEKVSGDFVNGSQNLKLNGLYEIQVEWDTVDGEDLNSNLVETSLSLPSGDHPLLVSLPYWDEVRNVWLDPTVSIDTITLEDQVVYIIDSRNPVHVFYAEFSIAFSDGTLVPNFVVESRLRIDLLPTEIATVTAAVRTALEVLITDLLNSPILTYQQRLGRIGTQVTQIQDYYWRHRNLCEDLVRVKGLRVQEILLSLNLDLKPGSEVVAVLAKGLLAVEDYLSPRFSYQSLEELLNTKSPDQIYEGPLLTRGFLPSERLLDTNTKETIYVSDLLALLMADPAVSAIRQLSVSSAINGLPVTENEANCLRISATDRFIPRLSLRNFLMDYQITRNGHPITITAVLLEAVEAEMERLSAAQQDIIDHQPLSRPAGEQLDLGAFSSVQEDLPINYAVGRAMPGIGAPAQQRGASRQLQAYLYIFDQILAQHAQLVGQLFQQMAVDNTTPVAYPSSPFFEVPGLADLIQTFTGDDWEAFIQDGENPWAQQLESAAGTTADALVQQQATLDHLLARQALVLGGYDKLLIDLQVSKATEIGNSMRRKLLKALPELVAERGLAFNYGLRDAQGLPFVWDTDNVSGAERMICHKMGWPSCKRRSLFNNPIGYFEFYEEADSDGITERRFRFRDINTGRILLSSSKSYPSDAAAREEIDEILTYGAILEHYRIIQASNGRYYFRLFDGNDDLIAWRIQSFATSEDARQEAERVSTFIYETFSMEGFYFLENILLRPKYEGDHTLQRISLVEGVLDNPFAFVVTVVIPTGNIRDFSDPGATAQPLPRTLRWQEPAFTRYLLETIRNEVPATTLINVVRLDLNSGEDEPATPSLQNFERTYREWLNTRFRTTASIAEKVTTQNELVDVLNAINP